MQNIPRREIIEITVPNLKLGNIKHNVVQGSYANVVKGNTVHVQLLHNHTRYIKRRAANNILNNKIEVQYNKARFS